MSGAAIKIHEGLDFENPQCKLDPSLFYPPLRPSKGQWAETSTEKETRETEAKRLCRSCEHRADCLEYALTAREEYGIWGGCTEKERKRLRKMRREAETQVSVRGPSKMLGS